LPLSTLASRLIRTTVTLALPAMLLSAQQPHPQNASLTAAWQPLGPSSIVSITYGSLTGRITALALDPNDTTGNTLYLGATGGGVWKSTNAASSLTAATFTPLTDTLPVFNSGTGAIPSLSIGTLAVQPAANPILLAGTGDPNNATDSFYGEGILRSSDGGLTWTLIQDSHDGTNGNHSFLGLSIAALAFSTTTPTLAVAAFTTSPQSTLVQASAIISIPGLYYSIDSGVTWQMATLYDGSQIVQQPQPIGTGETGNAATSVVWNPQRSLFLAAIRSHGYYSSPDGITWTRILNQPGTNLTTANCPIGVNGIGSATCPIFRGTLTVQPATGDTYALTIDANNLDQGLWQDLCNATSNTCATPAPTFATRIDNAALEIGSSNTAIAQGSYNLSLAAVPATAGTPANGTVLYAGTVDLYRCAIAPNSTTCSLRNTTNALNGCNAPAQVAPAQHALAASPTTTNPILFLGNDGGLWRSLDGVAETGSVCSSTDHTHFDNLNPAIAATGSLSEVVGFAQHPTDPNTLLAGLGANGSTATTTASTLTSWPQLSSGEGGYPSLDATTPNNWLLAIGAGINLKQCTLGSACSAVSFTPPATLSATQTANDTTLLDAPSLLDPAFTTNVLLGTCRIWRGPATSASTWSASNAISPAFNGSATPCTANSPLIRSIAAGGPSATSTNAQLSGSEVLYAGLAGTLDGGTTLGGQLFVTKSANTAFSATSWTNASSGIVTNDIANNGIFNPDGFDISSIAVDPHDPTGATVYATIQGFATVPHLYRSVDFGAHWLNITANLPGAPANAVLVDPNDANTLYIALDTGVYVTTQITTCATSNCWSILGTALPNAPVTTLAAAAQLPTGDGRLGMIRAATYGRGIWQTPLLTAVSLAQPAITLSTTSLTFAAQQVATQSPAQNITLTSSGNAPVTLGSPAITGDFTETDNCTGQTLAVNATCTVQVVFAPTATGSRTGLLTIYANIATGQATVALTSTGTAPASITFNPLTLNFAATLLNQTTASQTLTVNNTGGNASALQTPTITGDFAISANTCTAILAPTTACALSIIFTPTVSGNRTGTLSLTDSAGTQTAQLTGSGNSPATDTLTPNSITFPQQQINTTSPTQQIDLTNAGDIPLTLLNASITPGDFTIVNACGTSLVAHSTCAFSVAFVPTATGTRTATLTVTDQVRYQTVAVTGVGVAPPGVSLTPTSLTFPATGSGLTALAQSVTLTNNGGLPLTITNIAISPNFTIASDTCPATLPINAACNLLVVFAPTTAGPLSGTLTITDNAPNSTQAVTLFGPSIDFSLTLSTSTTETLSSGSTATYSLLLSSLASVTGNVTFACTGAPTNSTCSISPPTPNLGTTTIIIVTIQTGILASLDPHLFAPWRTTGSILLALTIPLALFKRRHSKQTFKSIPILLLLLCILASFTACGAGRELPATTTTTNTAYPTPTGTYNLTVSATSAGLTHTVPLTLIVQ
jgi:hypothetical protein